MIVTPTESRLLPRVGPALLLVVLAPIVAEFLLADFTIRNLPLLLALMPLYGGGALLVREVTRRAHRGWPTMILIAEGVAAHRRTEPWLRRIGLAVTIVFFLLGCASTAAFSLKSSPFIASP